MTERRSPTRAAFSGNPSTEERRAVLAVTSVLCDKVSDIIHTLADNPKSPCRPAARYTRALINNSQAMLYPTSDADLTLGKATIGGLIIPEPGSSKVIPALVCNLQRPELLLPLMLWSDETRWDFIKAIGAGIPYLYDAASKDPYWQLVDQAEFFRILYQGPPERQQLVAASITYLNTS